MKRWFQDDFRRLTAYAIDMSKTRSRRRPASSPDSLEDRIRALYDALPSSELCVADLLLDHPGRLVTHSATELAADAGVSKAAVTRLIRRLGYASFASARADARDAQQWGSPVYLEAEQSSPPEQLTPMSRHLAADQQILARTLGALDERELDAAARAMTKARRVVVVGYRNSAWLAMYAHSQLGLLRPGVELAPLPAETLAEALVDLGAQDLLLAVGFRRRVPALAAALREASAVGARIVLVTDPSGAAELRMADWTLACHCRGAAMFDSYVAAVSVLNLLAAQVAQAMGEPARRRLQGVEQWHRRLNDLA
ncbi:MAG: MurR/RpiR family transcriptional regulator [Burkholderiaceae bacterium]|nr:MurR/RpiR family transcriptional regulator [Burkholderiaceae bacterium]